MERHGFAAIVTTWLPDEASVREIGDALVKGHRICCYQMLPVRSKFWWHGRFEDVTEWETRLTCRPEDAEKVEDEVRERHPYEVPCIRTDREVPFNREYVDWMLDKTSMGKRKGHRS